MSIGVLGGRRTFRWESASKPALNRCLLRSAQGQHPPASLPHHLGLYPCPHHHRHHHHHHHRPRRRHVSVDAPAWQRRPSDVAPPSLASSWQTEPSSLLTPDALSVSGERPASSAEGSSLESRNVLLAKRPFVAARMSSASAPRGTDDAGESPTAAAREVKQYLNRTLFPRPSSTLHGYASLYHRLKKLPTTHRKARQRGKTAPEATTSPPTVDASARGLEGAAEGKPGPRDAAEGSAPCPPRVEIHIYVPTAAAAASGPFPQEGAAQRNL